jgi:hypothetical protein
VKTREHFLLRFQESAIEQELSIDESSSQPMSCSGKHSRQTVGDKTITAIKNEAVDFAPEMLRHYALPKE